MASILLFLDWGETIIGWRRLRNGWKLPLPTLLVGLSIEDAVFLNLLGMITAIFGDFFFGMFSFGVTFFSFFYTSIFCLLAEMALLGFSLAAFESKEALGFFFTICFYATFDTGFCSTSFLLRAFLPASSFGLCEAVEATSLELDSEAILRFLTFDFFIWICSTFFATRFW